MKHYVIYRNTKDQRFPFVPYLDKEVADAICGILNQNVTNESSINRASYLYQVVEEIW